MKRWCVAGVAVFLAACSGSDDAVPTTASIAATVPTVAPPTVTSVQTLAPTAPPTTLAATTVPPATLSTVAPTTAGPTPTEIAETEIRATLANIDSEVDACFGDPDNCDIDPLLAKYFVADDNDVVPLFRDVWSDLKVLNAKKVWQGRIERTVAWVTVDAEGTTGTSYHCEIDNTVNIPKDTPAGASTTVQPGAITAFIRYYYEWQKQPDGSWIVIHSESGAGEVPEKIEYGEMPSLTESEIALCF